MTIAAPIIALSLWLPAPAQVPAADPTASTLPLKPGEKVIVTRARTTGTLAGRVLRLADDGLVLENGDVVQTVPYRDLDRVVRRRDSIWNGALIGYAAGFGAGAALAAADGCNRRPGSFDPCFDDTGLVVAFGALISGPIGMAAGAIGDALRRKPHVVFDRLAPPHATMAVTPALVRGGAGFRAAIRF
jgi:hypothetical protein